MDLTEEKLEENCQELNNKTKTKIKLKLNVRSDCGTLKKKGPVRI